MVKRKTKHTASWEQPQIKYQKEAKLIRPIQKFLKCILMESILGIDRTSLIYMNIRLKTLTCVLLLSLMRFCINLASYIQGIRLARRGAVCSHINDLLNMLCYTMHYFLKVTDGSYEKLLNRSLNMWFPNENQKLKMVTTTAKIKHFL